MADIDKPRRSFLARIAALFGGLALLEAGWIATSFFGARRRASAAPDKSVELIAGPIERFEPGSVTAFGEGHFYLARLEDGGFLALHRKCTHLGCTVPWSANEQRFSCPCHGSAFDIRGDVLSAPATRALDRFAVKIDNGVVKVDTSRPIRRAVFEVEQVARA
ncbi:MAG: ubiquinol-cytochrome c reductase iron-sulfur subunit [Gammaproteobacteria bacterium]|jgi:cytochrome b6-f complex iron-sulfur subunit|nr:ubiquinol-cytochrome c reductase iron-sulfur subunit [Gammaproteobacteria bacterium]